MTEMVIGRSQRNVRATVYGAVVKSNQTRVARRLSALVHVR